MLMCLKALHDRYDISISRQFPITLEQNNNYNNNDNNGGAIKFSRRSARTI